jgi:hypothetical protein
MYIRKNGKKIPTDHNSIASTNGSQIATPSKLPTWAIILIFLTSTAVLAFILYLIWRR